MKQADALVNADRGAEAAPLYLSAAEGAPPLEALDLRRRAAEQLLLSGHVNEGVDLLRPVLEEHGLPYPNTRWKARLTLLRQLARLRLRGTRFRPQSEAKIGAELRARINACWAAGRGLAVADPTRAGGYVVEALLLAFQTGDIHHVVPGLAFVGSHSMYDGTRSAVARGIDLIAQAEALAARSEEPYLIAFTTHCRGRAHFCVGEWRQAVTAMDRSLEILQRRCAGVAWERNLSEGLTGQALLALGELAERSRRAHARLREANEISDVFGGVDAAIHIAFDRLVEGDPEAARAGARAAIAKAPPDGFASQHHLATMVETLSDLYQGRAAASLIGIEAELRKRRGHGVQVRRIELLYRRGVIAVTLAVRDARERPRLLRLATSTAASLDHEGRPHADAAAAVIRAGVAWGERRIEHATGHLRVAQRRYEAAEMKVHAACARRKIGELTGAGGALIAEADAALKAEGVAAPSRWATMYTGIG